MLSIVPGSEENQPFSAATVENNREDEAEPNPEGPPGDTEQRLADSRDNAITAAVEKASNSVVSIMSSATG
jgi:hypothetical protein